MTDDNDSRDEDHKQNNSSNRINPDEWREYGKKRQSRPTRKNHTEIDKKLRQEFDDEDVVNFLKHRKKSRSYHTYKSDVSAIKKYVPFLEPDKTVSEATYDDVWIFMEGLAKEDLIKGTIKSHRSTISKLHEYLNVHHQENLPSVSSMSVEDLQAKESLVDRKPLSRTEVRKLMNTTDSGSHPVRDTLLLSTLYHTGARVNEVCSIKLEDVLEDEEAIMITNGKMDSNGPVPFPSQLQYKYRQWIDYYRKQYRHSSSSEYVFLSERNPTISTHRVQDIVKEAADHADLQEIRISPRGERYRWITPHIFRHTINEHMKNDGVPEKVRMRIFRHKHRSSMEPYDHDTDIDFRGYHDEFEGL